MNMTRRIFVSYASEDREIADRVSIALSKSGTKVFFDRGTLSSGDDYNEKIRDEIKGSDVLVFLISPNSVASGKYTLTELKFAREKWPNPRGKVLPVMIRNTDYAVIPNYLKAVTIETPSGDIAAETKVAVDKILRRRRPSTVVKALVISAVVALAVVIQMVNGMQSQIPPRDSGDRHDHSDNILFADSFSENSLNLAWQPVTGEWSVRDGVLQAHGYHYERGRREWAVLTLSKPIPRDCSVSFRTRFDGGSTAEVMLRLSNNRYVRAYIYLIDQAVMLGDGTFLERNEPGVLGHSELAEAVGGGKTVAKTSYPLAKQIWYNVTATAIGNHYTIEVGGQRVLEHIDEESVLSSSGTIGFVTNGQVQFDDVVVRKI